MKLRDYQIESRDKAINILRNKGIVYLCAEVRTGKTIISLSIVNELKYSRCLFLTKKLAIKAIIEDYNKSGFTFFLKVTNYEQLHNETANYDIVIADEAHSMGAFQKPSLRTKLFKERYFDKPIIFLSGTPNPESWSQLFHQFWVSIYSPWHEYKSFYKWAVKYVDKRQRMINGFRINDYSRGRKELIQADIDPYMVKLSQEEAGFTSFVEEEVLIVNINKNIYKLMDKLKKDKVYTMKNGEVILCDTPVRLMSAFHQLSSGTIKCESGERLILDKSKAYFIKSKFAGQKIAIAYNFVAEGLLLRDVFPNNTEDPIEFQKRDDLVFIKQVVSSREGITLSTADALVLYNIAFSATSYWQIRARIQTMDRIKASKLYWIFSDKGIEEKILKVVQKKRNFTVSYFKRRYL